jgi:hypothetical protein
MNLSQGMLLIVLISMINSPLKAEEKTVEKKEQVLEFTGGVIEGGLNRPSMLMELGSNFKDFNDLILLREDFNKYHKLDSSVRFRYIEEGL